MAQVVSGGIRIHHEVEGSGTPLVLLHGLADSGAAAGVAPVLRYLSMMTGGSRILSN